MGSVFASSTLPGVVSAGAAIETLLTAGEGRKGGGVRGARLLYLNAQPSQPVAQFFGADAAIFTTLRQTAKEGTAWKMNAE